MVKIKCLKEDINWFGILVSFVLIISLTINTRAQSISSLELKLKNTKKSSGRIEILNELSYQYRISDPDKTIEYASEALQLAKIKKNKVQMQKALDNLGLGYKYLGKYDAAINYHEQAIKLAEELKDPELKANSLNRLALIFRLQGNFDKALSLFSEALALAVDNKLTSLEADILSNLGSVYRQLGLYEKTLNCYLKVIQFREIEKDTEGLSSIYNNLGNLYSDLGYYDASLFYYFKSLKLKQKIGAQAAIVNSYDNIGGIYIKKGKPDSALFFLKKAIAINNFNKNLSAEASIMNNMGLAYTEKLLWIKAIESFELSIKIRKQLSEKFGLAENYLSYSELYTKLQKYPQALSYLGQSREIAEENKLLPLQKKIYKQYSVIYQLLGNYNLAYSYLLKFHNINEELEKNSSLDIISRHQVLSDLNKTENILFEKETEIQHLKNRTSNLTLIIIVSLLVILALGMSLVLYRSRQRKKVAVKLQEYAGKLEKEVADKTKNLKSEIKAKNEAEQKQIENLSFLQLLVDTIPTPVYYKNPDGKYIGWNKSFLAFSGKSNEEVAGKTVQDIFPSDFASIAQKSDEAVFLNRKNTVYQLKHINTNNEVRDILIHKAPVLKDGKVTAIIGVITDISEIVKFEEELRIAREKAEEATYLKSMFLANMSHEIRTPLSSVIGMVDIMKQAGLNEEQADYLNMIDLSSQNLLNILNNILDFSKIEAGALQLEHIDFDLHEAIDFVVKLHKFKAKEKKNRINVYLPDSLPAYINSDPLRLKQILINLLSNAIRFTSNGEITLLLQIEKEQKNEYQLKFTIEDTGIGIPAEKQKEIFTAYRQVDSSTSRKFGGTGLGLLICKNLVTLMGGQIGFRSTEGEGSSFWFRIKVGKTEGLIKNQQANLSFELNNTEGNNPGLNILVAEDDLMNQRLIGILLEKLGYKFKVAENGEIAYNTFINGDFDVVLMDINMPVLDGMTVSTMIRTFEKETKRAKQARIIAVTAKVIQGDKEKCLESGMNGFLSKPFRINELKSQLENPND